MRLNLGSGPIAIAGWTNVDRSPNTWLSKLPALKSVLRRIGILKAGHEMQWDKSIQRHDLRRLPFAPASIDSVYSSHALEHLYLDDAQQALDEAYRVLRGGGLLRLALPDGEALAAQFIAEAARGNPEAGWLFNERLMAQPKVRPTGLRSIVARTGAHTHRWQPTVTMVEQMLQRSGFEDIRVCSFRQGQLEDLHGIETREESFFVESRKPAVG